MQGVKSSNKIKEILGTVLGAAIIGSAVDMYVIRDGDVGVELKIKIEDKNS